LAEPWKAGRTSALDAYTVSFARLLAGSGRSSALLSLGFGQPTNLNKNPGTLMNADKTWINADKMGDAVGLGGGVRSSAHDGRKRRA